jgi:cysteinyl-tRNA synthetase
MSMKYLGEHFDIHGGGLDNQFPHHECEIAQSEAATGKPFAKVWLHNNMVTVNGQKMSKSLGNFVTLDELFGKYDPMTCRFFVLQGHYRSPQDFSPEALDAAQRGFARLARTVLALRERIAFEPDLPELPDPRWDTFARRFHACLEDDFNTAGGISVLFDLVKESNERLTAGSDAGSLRPAERLFSRLGEEILGFLFTPAGQGGAGPGMEKGLLDFMVALRTRLRAQKHWTLADEIRDILGRFGVSVEDGKDGSRWVKKWNAGGAEATDPHGSGAAK